MKIAVIVIISFAISSCLCSQKTNSSEMNDNKKSSKIEIKEMFINKDYVLPEKLDYTINSINIDGDILTIDINYKGGCGEHNFELMFNEMYAKSLPVIAGLFLSHTTINENCQKDINKILKYNITKSRHPQYKEAYIKVYGIDTKLLYKY